MVVLSGAVAEIGVRNSERCVDRLTGSQTDGSVYVDAILVFARRSKVKQGACYVAQKLRRAGFLISPKSVCEPTQRLDLVRRWFDTEKGKMGNKEGLLVGFLEPWVLVVVEPFDSMLM